MIRLPRSRRLRHALLSLALVVVAGPAPAPARASVDGDLESRVAALETLLAATQAELAAVREELAARQAAPGEERAAQLERELDALSRELEDRALGAAAGGEVEPPGGVAPSAGKVYGRDHGVSLGGYGEMLWEGFDSTRDDGAPSGKLDRADFLRAVLYFGYRFNDRILFNSEIEVEHASTGSGGEVSLEQAYFDFRLGDEVGARAGLLLAPIGFVNEIHEPPTFLGAARPLVERVIIPTTWRENGAGLFGDAGPLSWRAYVMTGLDASGFSASSGLRGGRQKGAQATAEDLALAARLDWTVRPGLRLGVSAFVGDSGQGARTPGGDAVGGRVSLWEGHAEWKAAGWDLRALWSRVEIDDAAAINELNGLTGTSSVGSRLGGWYAQAGFDVLSRLGTGQELVPFVRWSELDTQQRVPDGWARNPANDREILTVGAVWRPHPQVAIKLDWQDVDDEAGTGVDQWNIALGYSF